MKLSNKVIGAFALSAIMLAACGKKEETPAPAPAPVAASRGLVVATVSGPFSSRLQSTACMPAPLAAELPVTAAAEVIRKMSFLPLASV